MAFVLLLPACLRLGGRTGGDAGPGPEPSEGEVRTDGGVVGAGCAVDPETRVELCTTVNVCPRLAVDHDVFPFCGLRPRGDFFDLACWCNGFVCPMGAPTTCTEARRLLETQFEAQVCAQVSEGRCTQPQRDGVDGGRRCDEDCLRACGGGSASGEVCGCVGR